MATLQFAHSDRVPTEEHRFGPDCIDGGISKNEGLAAEIDQLAGPELLQHIRHIHPPYEAMVQAALQRESGQQNLLEHVRAIQRAVVAYATRVWATVEDDDATTIETARNALDRRGDAAGIPVGPFPASSAGASRSSPRQASGASPRGTAARHGQRTAHSVRCGVRNAP